MDTSTFQLLFVDAGLLYPDIDVSTRIVLAQAVHESANFGSHVFQTNNNCFGMQAPTTRDTLATNKGKGGYANFSNVLDCIRDYYLWCRARNVKNDADLWALLCKPSSQGGYAADPQYSNKVADQIRALEKAGKYINPAVIKAGSIGVLAAAVGAASLGVVQLAHS